MVQNAPAESFSTGRFFPPSGSGSVRQFYYTGLPLF